MKAHASTAPSEAEAFIQRRLSLRHLRVVLALSEGGSISAAADFLNVTQPAVSKTLSEIENGLGQTLFVRRGRNMGATPIGQHLIHLARRTEASMHRAGETTASLVRGTTGEVVIGATNAAMAELLPNAILAIKQEQPHVTVSVRSHAVKGLFAELREGKIDIVVARAPVGDVPADLHSQALTPMPEVVAISALHPLSRSRNISWETLSQQSWIWQLPGTHSRVLQDRFWNRKGLSLPTKLIETGDNMMALSLMRRAPLLAIMPLPVAQEAAKLGVLVILPLKVDLGLSGLMLWHLNEPQSALVERFKELLQEAAVGVASYSYTSASGSVTSSS